LCEPQGQGSSVRGQIDRSGTSELMYVRDLILFPLRHGPQKMIGFGSGSRVRTSGSVGDVVNITRNLKICKECAFSAKNAAAKKAPPDTGEQDETQQIESPHKTESGRIQLRVVLGGDFRGGGAVGWGMGEAVG